MLASVTPVGNVNAVESPPSAFMVYKLVPACTRVKANEFLCYWVILKIIPRDALVTVLPCGPETAMLEVLSVHVVPSVVTRNFSVVAVWPVPPQAYK